MNLSQSDFDMPASPAEDARDLLSRLYREIGISAVAAALEVSEKKPEPRERQLHEIPGVLRGNDIAA